VDLRFISVAFEVDHDDPEKAEDACGCIVCLLMGGTSQENVKGFTGRVGQLYRTS
jgi:hypothetical protein